MLAVVFKFHKDDDGYYSSDMEKIFSNIDDAKIYTNSLVSDRYKKIIIGTRQQVIRDYAIFRGFVIEKIQVN